MLHLLKFAYDVNHTYDHHTYIVLTEEEYLLFTAHDGEEETFPYDVCSGHGNDTSEVQCSLIQELSLDASVPGLNNFLNNTELYENVKRWMSECASHSTPAGYTTLSFRFHFTGEKCSTCCLGKVNIDRERMDVILTNEQARKFESLGGESHRFLLPKVYHCYNGHNVQVWASAAAQAAEDKIYPNPQLTQLVTKWLDNDADTHVLTFQMDTSIEWTCDDTCSSTLPRDRKETVFRQVLLTREQCLIFHQQERWGNDFGYTISTCPRHSTVLLWDFDYSSSLSDMSSITEDAQLTTEILRCVSEYEPHLLSFNPYLDNEECDDCDLREQLHPDQKAHIFLTRAQANKFISLAGTQHIFRTSHTCRCPNNHILHRDWCEGKMKPWVKDISTDLELTNIVTQWLKDEGQHLLIFALWPTFCCIQEEPQTIIYEHVLLSRAEIVLLQQKGTTLEFPHTTKCSHGSTFLWTLEHIRPIKDKAQIKINTYLVTQVQKWLHEK